MLTVYVQDLASDFQGHLSSPCSLSLPVLYGAVLTLVHLGPASLVDVFLPHMQLLVRHLAVLSESATTNVKYAISKVMESIFVSGNPQQSSYLFTGFKWPLTGCVCVCCHGYLGGIQFGVECS